MVADADRVQVVGAPHGDVVDSTGAAIFAGIPSAELIFGRRKPVGQPEP